MKESKREWLMFAARKESKVEVPVGFCDQVLRAIGSNERADKESLLSMTEQLAAFFPRLAAVALGVIVVAAAFEFFAGGDVTAQLTEASDQWLLPLDWL
jgi:hypothetical protein